MQLLLHTRMQALEQHSKAVSDLQAAVAMLPGDKEVCVCACVCIWGCGCACSALTGGLACHAQVGEQLSRAQQLLEEHRAAKKMKGLVRLPACSLHLAAWLAAAPARA